MGSRFSSEEKLLRHQKEELILESNSQKTFGFYKQYGNHPVSNPFEKHIQHRYKKKRNISFNGRFGKNDYLRTKSHSLNAILEELYSLRAEETFDEKNRTLKYETGGPLIPRIKLKRSISSFKEERNYKPLYKMSSESEIFIRETTTSSIPNTLINNEKNETNTLMSENNTSILLNDRNYEEISSKSDENYFAKNFDDCMKRLQLIEKEHDLIEKVDIQHCSLYKDEERVQIDQQEIITTTSINENYNQAHNFNYLENGLEDKMLCENESHLEPRRQSYEKMENVEKSLQIETTPTKNDDTSAKKIEEPIESWYTNLKQQFEKEEQEIQEQRTKEMTCRITGATLKNQTDKNKTEDEKEKDTRHYFSRLVKTNKSLIDEELPDPDKVKQLRAMFQESLNSTLKRRLDKKLGGSLQNISTRTAEQQMSRPLSAQCYRNDLFCEIGQKSKEEKKARETPKKPEEFQIENTKKKLEKLEKDLKVVKENKNRRVLQPKWTDTGSVSSGIGSDLSNYDTDLECYSREGTEQDEMTISDDDSLEEVKDKHYVQNEILEKIRSFGTSVTYYGGEMITCSVGPLLSPTTQAIIEEISEKYGQQTHPARSFDEFYRKYVETIEPNRKKKIGRARSFGQNDVFQKPNVLSNTEIELYKNDLEIEIGIKKPSGIQQNSLKRKVTKSASLGFNSGKPEKPPIVPIATDSLEDLKTNVKGEVANNANENTISNDMIEKLKSETNAEFSKKTENYNGISKQKETECEATTETEKKTEKTATSVAKELYSRSKSVPEGLLVDKNPFNNKCEIISENVENPAKEIFFSYEKSIFNEKKNSDMKFEEFEVCESLSEKLKKLEKTNPFDKSSDSQETLARDDAELKKLEGELEKDDVSLTTANLKNNSEKQHAIVPELPLPGENENTYNEKKDFKYNPSRWPIETSVMVDIQKNNEQTPKLITNGKTVAKTKIRLF